MIGWPGKLERMKEEDTHESSYVYTIPLLCNVDCY